MADGSGPRRGRASTHVDIDSAPTRPGVYLWVGAGGNVLYVGKARSLRSRLQSYRNGTDSKSRTLRATADHVEWIEVPSEADALTLEAQLVAAHQPPHNVRLREPTRWPLLTLSRHRHPRLLVTSRADPSVHQWGPYPHRRDAHEGIELLATHFGIRTCTDATYRTHQQQGRPCMLADLGRCAAPCVTPEGYGQVVADTVRFLDGDHLPTVGRLHRQMRRAAADRNFERAAALRDQADGLRALIERRPQLVGLEQVDGVRAGLAHDRDAGAGLLVVVDVRDGQLRTQRQWPYDHPDPVPVELLAVAAGAGPDVVRHPVVDDLAARQLADLLRRRAQQPDRSAQAAAQIAAAAGLDRSPLRIECVDVSHLDGNDTVAGLSVIHDGRPRKGDYRTFRLDGHGNDDVGAIGTVVGRRLARFTDEQDLPADERTGFGRLPDLLVVDGGAGQLAAACDAAARAGVDVPIVALAKQEEVVHLPDGRDVQMGAGPGRWLLQHARDEAHRIAGRAQRSRRRRHLTSRLEQVPGVGPARRRALLDLFGGADGLLSATVEQLAAAPGVGPGTARAIHTWLHPSESAGQHHDDGPADDLEVADR